VEGKTVQHWYDDWHADVLRRSGSRSSLAGEISHDVLRHLATRGCSGVEVCEAEMTAVAEQFGTESRVSQAVIPS